jgi:hypothetical protein
MTRDYVRFTRSTREAIAAFEAAHRGLAHRPDVCGRRHPRPGGTLHVPGRGDSEASFMQVFLVGEPGGVVHHGAEIGLLRDLRRSREPAA